MSPPHLPRRRRDPSDGSLQDGVMSETAADVSPGLLLSLLPQRQGQAKDARPVLLPQHTLPERATQRRVAGQLALRRRRRLRLLSHAHRAAVPPGGASGLLCVVT